MCAGRYHFHVRRLHERSFLLAAGYWLPSQILSEEGDDLPSVEVDPGAPAAGVVTAGEPGHVNRHAGAADARDHVAREVCGEGQVVARGDEAHGACALIDEPVGEGERADGQPEPA